MFYKFYKFINFESHPVVLRATPQALCSGIVPGSSQESRCSAGALTWIDYMQG